MTDFVQDIDDCLKISDIPIEDNSITEWKEVDYTPQTQSNNNTTAASITIDINASDSYIVPSKSYLIIEGRLMQSDNNAAYAGNNELTLTNNAVMYLFTDTRHSMGGTVLETTQNPGQTTSMLGYLRFPDDYNSTAGLHQCWCKDTNTFANNQEFSASVAVLAAGCTLAKNLEYNQGFATRTGFLFSSDFALDFEKSVFLIFQKVGQRF